MATTIKRLPPGALKIKTILTSSFYLQPCGTKQIIFGYNFLHNFTPCIQIVKHNTPQNGVVIDLTEWENFISNQREIDNFFGTDGNKQPIQLSEKLVMDFKTIYKKPCLVFTETQLQGSHYYPRQIILQQETWKVIKSILSAIDTRVHNCIRIQKTITSIFENICDSLGSASSKSIYPMLHNLNFSDFSNSIYSEEEEYIFKELKYLCADLIVNNVMEKKIEFPNFYK